MKNPINWKQVKLEDILIKLIGGGTPSTSKAEYWNGEIAWTTSAHLTGREIQTGQKYITKKGLLESSTCIVPKQNILIATRVGIGKVAINKIDIAISQDLTGILIDKKIVMSEYLYWALTRKKNKLKALAQGSTIKGILRKDVAKIQIPLPPLPEQKKIAEILSTVDSAIENVDRGIISIEKIKKTLTYNLFTYGLRNKGTKTLKIGKIPKDWKISSLSEIAKVRYGLGQPPPKKEKGIPMIRATNIKEGKIFLKNLLFIDPKDIPDSRNPYLKENDIIVVRSGAYTGDVAYITQEWEGSVAGYDLIITPSENINPKYLSLFLLSNKIQKRYFGTLKERSAQSHLNSHQLEMTPIVYPTLVDQKKIAEIISATEQKKELLEKRKLRLLQLKKGLMNDLLTGQKRVRLES